MIYIDYSAITKVTSDRGSSETANKLHRPPRSPQISVTSETVDKLHRLLDDHQGHLRYGGQKEQ